MTLSRATLERFQAGEAEAFAEVVRACSGLVRGVVAGYWRSPFEQEEAMQEVWAHVYKQRAAFDPSRGDELVGWLATLARRRALDLLRRSTDPAAPGREEDALDAGEEAAPTSVDPAELSDLSVAVEQFQSKLGPAWRQFFTLFFVQGLDFSEISAAMNISRLRCKYMKKVLLGRAQRSAPLLAALGRARTSTGGDRGPPPG